MTPLPMLMRLVFAEECQCGRTPCLSQGYFITRFNWGRTMADFWLGKN